MMRLEGQGPRVELQGQSTFAVDLEAPLPPFEYHTEAACEAFEGCDAVGTDEIRDDEKESGRERAGRGDEAGSECPGWGLRIDGEDCWKINGSNEVRIVSLSFVVVVLVVVEEPKSGETA
jgi:hypothetical protein